MLRVLCASLALASAVVLAAPSAAQPPATEIATCPDGTGGRWSASRVQRGDAVVLALVHTGIDGARGAALDVRRADAARGVTAQLRGDGRGGAWLAWTELDYFAMTTEVRAAHVGAGGVVLSSGEAALASFADLFDAVSLLPDGQGGAYVAWREADARHERALRLARLTAQGRPASGWPASGLTVAERQGNVRPRLVTDGEGGAIVVADSDPNRAGGEPFAQRVSPAAALLR